METSLSVCRLSVCLSLIIILLAIIVVVVVVNNNNTFFISSISSRSSTLEVCFYVQFYNISWPVVIKSNGHRFTSIFENTAIKY